MLFSSIGLDRLFYSMMGIRLLIYIYFLILNLFQSIVEARKMIRRSGKGNTRFFVFLSNFFFCSFRVAGNIIFYFQPTKYLIGSYYYMCIGAGTYFIALCWTFIAGYWMQLLYMFFITDDVRTSHITRVKLLSYSLGFLFFIYEVPVLAYGLKKDLGLVESVGFIVFIVVYLIIVWTNGYILMRSLKNHQKKLKMGPNSNYSTMIFKTKVLLVTGVVMVLGIIIHDITFGFLVEKKYMNFPISTMITGIIDIGQMISVMLVLSNGNITGYVRFKKIKSLNSQGSETGGISQDSSKYSKHSRDQHSKSQYNSSVDYELKEVGRVTLTNSTTPIINLNPTVSIDVSVDNNNNNIPNIIINNNKIEIDKIDKIEKKMNQMSFTPSSEGISSNSDEDEVY